MVNEPQAAPRSNLSLPLALPACLPVLWSRVLFPGSTAGPSRLRWQSLLLLVVLPSVLLYPCLAFHLLEPDESRYAEIPREMLVRGEWVVPYLQGEPYLDKPPLLYWLVIGSYRMFGVHDWTARLVPALALHAAILATYLLGRRTLGERAAFWGALTLSLAPGFLSIGRLLVLDGLLALWVTLALLCAFEALRGDRLRWGWWLVAALACGLGILTKGPVALLLLAPPLLAYRWLTGATVLLGWRAFLAFGLVVFAVVLPWYVAVCIRLPEFVRYFIWEHNVVRFVTGFDHLRPVWFYVPIVLLGLLPGTLLVWPVLRFLFSGDPATAGRRCPALGFMLLGGCWCVFFFSLSSSKLPTYVLPAFPPLALALGYYLACSRWLESRWPVVVAGGAFVLLGVGHHVLVPWYAWYRSPMGRPEVVAHYCGDPETPVICYPRHCDSVAFYLGRDDLRNFRSKDVAKEMERLRYALRTQPRTVVLCTHRHSLHGLRQALPPEVRVVEETHMGLGPVPGVPEWLGKKLAVLMGETAHGLCDVAVVEQQAPEP